jgi:hypothetical protein
MFLNDLKIVVRNTNDSFVGIRRNQMGEKEFILPHGFEDFPTDNFDTVKSFFFKMYKTFKKFELSKNFKIQEYHSLKDNTQIEAKGFEFKDKNDDDNIIYSKINLIENFIENEDDLIIASIYKKYGKKEEIDYTKIPNLLHKAIYLDNDMIYIDETEGFTNILKYDTTDIVDMFCFIYCELMEQLEEIESIDNIFKNSAKNFISKYLNSNDSIFNQDNGDMILTILKEVLSNINKITVYKDETYWIYYEAIENFLYGELELCDEGIYWGIKNFSSIWEELCHSYAFITFKNHIGYADTNMKINGKNCGNYTIGNKKIYVKNGFDYIFEFSFQYKFIYLRPDLVHGTFFFIKNINEFYEDKVEFQTKKITGYNLLDFSIFKKDVTFDLDNIYKFFDRRFKNIKGHKKNNFVNWKGVTEKDIENYKLNYFDYNITKAVRLVDFKYHSINDFTSDKLLEKVKNDVIKQMLYENIILQYTKFETSKEVKIMSYFLLPKFILPNNDNKEYAPVIDFDDNINFAIKEAGIKIQLADFTVFQKTYLEI